MNQPTPQKRFALLSVTNKQGVAEFGKDLVSLGFTLLSTGGTLKVLQEANILVVDVGEFTGHPECLDGRVKTLHPKVHGSILRDRSKSSHDKESMALGFEKIDVVCVNLYDFASQASGQGLPLSDAIQHIDIGGPTMLRAAAKQYKDVYAVVDPADYPSVVTALKNPDQQSLACLDLRTKLANKVFATTSAYDQLIAAEFGQNISGTLNHEGGFPLADSPHLPLSLKSKLRYGENAHQTAALYAWSKPATGLAGARILQGKELSYNNYMDLDAALRITQDFGKKPAVAIIKHTNPCAVSAQYGLDGAGLFNVALSGDPKCSFGGIVSANISVDKSMAEAMSSVFFECIVAPHFTPEAIEVFSSKKNLRLLEVSVDSNNAKEPIHSFADYDLRSISGGILIQSQDIEPISPKNWQCVSKAVPDDAMMTELVFAMTVARHVKSNAIVLTTNNKTIGIGAGQMSRVDAARIAVDKARELGHSPCGAVAASDAFFPFRDSVDIIAKAGVTAIVQPGGSMRDQESIDAANEHGLVMMLTGQRCFRH
jgi:phosphoribosylaminoimidazolecarboxamide formyltransferase/IMP cyclohydrolase